MTKRELFDMCWVPIRVRLPPDIPNNVTYYNWKAEEVFSLPGELVRKHAELELAGKGSELSWDRRISHWMRIQKPSKSKPKVKRGKK